MQVTAGALTGQFGPRPKYWAEKFVGEGLTHIIATDAHSSTRRIPVMSEARAVAEKLLGAKEAQNLVEGRPAAIMGNRAPSQVAPLPTQKPAAAGWWRKLLRRDS